MKDALQNISEELAAQITERFQSPEIQQFLSDTKAAPDAQSGTFEVVITTENLDRYNEVIKMDGWQLDHYLTNPVVLWMHDHSQPIGMATSIQVDGPRMVAKGKFAPTAKAQEIRQLYDAGIIRATSVGFIEKEREGNLITQAELLEFSFVSVPANPYALSLAMEKELSVNELVTKGFMRIEKDAEDEDEEDEEGTVPESEDGEEPSDEEVDAALEEAKAGEKAFHTKALSPVIENLKAAIVVLEALGTKSEEPEDDEEPEEAAEEVDKALDEFHSKRKLLQDAATMIGDVLAEVRQAKAR